MAIYQTLEGYMEATTIHGFAYMTSKWVINPSKWRPQTSLIRATRRDSYGLARSLSASRYVRS